MKSTIPQINMSDSRMIVNGWQGVTTVLGPGRRFALWLQGCLKNCLGCIHPVGRSFIHGKELTIVEILDLISSQRNLEGITISGGEPFLQSSGLSVLLKKIKSDFNLGVIVYTGYYHSELIQSENENITQVLRFVDLLIDGPYESGLDDNRPARGSSNQKLIPLSDRYLSYSQTFSEGNRETFIYPNSDSLICVGIPGKETKKIINKL